MEQQSRRSNNALNNSALINDNVACTTARTADAGVPSPRRFSMRLLRDPKRPFQGDVMRDSRVRPVSLLGVPVGVLPTRAIRVLRAAWVGVEQMGGGVEEQLGWERRTNGGWRNKRKHEDCTSVDAHVYTCINSTLHMHETITCSPLFLLVLSTMRQPPLLTTQTPPTPPIPVPTAHSHPLPPSLQCSLPTCHVGR